MKFVRISQGLAALLALGAPSRAGASAAEASPLGKALELLEGLSKKIKREGEDEEKAFEEYSNWCTEVKRNRGFEIRTATDQKDAAEAKIGELEAKISVAGSKIEELAAAIATTTAQLKDATAVRDREVADFLSGEKELMSVVDTLGRAINILEREMAKGKKGAAALAQLDSASMAGVLETLGAVVDAAAFSVDDRSKLLALVQAHQAADSEDGELSAPQAAAYESKSSGIVDVLEDMKEKAEEQLRNLRKAETESRHNFDLLKQSLENQADASSKDLASEKAGKAAAQEGKATTEGALAVATRELKAAQEDLAATTTSCGLVEADHEESVKSRNEELKVIAEAIDILQSSTGGAAEQSYSFVQVASTLRTRADMVRSEVVMQIHKLARQHHSAALAQLASRVATVSKYASGSGASPLEKIRGLIQDLLQKLQQEASAEESEKGFCDAEMKKTAEKRGELEADLAKLDAKLGQAVARSSELKSQVAELQQELAAIAKEQAELDKIRQESHRAYVKAKAELEQGLSGVRQALGKLREYYGSKASLLQDDANMGDMMSQPEAPKKHDKSSGGASGIIGLLEVVESDFAKNLAQEEAAESDAQESYEKVTQENKVTVATKDKDVAYKSQEAAGLDKTVTEFTSDRESLSSELAAVMEYDGKLKERCIAKPESYEERAARRASEINGLKEALNTLQNEMAFTQRGRRGVRGGRQAALAA